MKLESLTRFFLHELMRPFGCKDRGAGNGGTVSLEESLTRFFSRNECGPAAAETEEAWKKKMS